MTETHGERDYEARLATAKLLTAVLALSLDVNKQTIISDATSKALADATDAVARLCRGDVFTKGAE